MDVSYRIARIGLHRFEEPCISGSKGSGTIFFSGCNLRCSFCQNHEISHGKKGLEVSEKELVFAFEKLQDMGAHNINLVTPSNWTNQLVHTLNIAKPKLKIPIVWNSGGYETVNNVKKLEGLVDIFLPDFKYGDDALAWEYSHAKNYCETAKAAITEMRRQQPADAFDNDGVMRRGVIVRHLVLPNATENSAKALGAIADIDKSLFVSVMGQYFPTPAVSGHPSLGRRLTESEYNAAIDAFFEAGLSNGFSQELDSAIEDYVPSFDLDELARFLER